MKKLKLILYNHKIRVPLINPNTGMPYRGVAVNIEAGLANMTCGLRAILINRKVPYLRYLGNLIHEFGHVLVYILIEDILDLKLDSTDKYLFHKLWDFIYTPDVFFKKTELYRMFYEFDAWEKEEKEKYKVALM